MGGSLGSRAHVLYTELAEYYDIIYSDYLKRAVPRLVDFAEQVFKREAGIPVRKVLDIACGTGGPTIELARRGYEVMGVDLHEEVLRIARRKAEKEGLKIKFLQRDARELEFSEEFDAATMFFSSISYMTSFDDLVKMLTSVLRALRPGGVFIADEPNPYDTAEHIGRSPGPVVWDVDGANGEKLVIIDYREFENVQATLHFKRVIMVVGEGGEARTYVMHDVIRLYTAHELKMAAQSAGFSRALIYGDYRITENELSSARRLFLVAVKEG